MTAITVRQATLADLDALAPMFDGYRQFYGQSANLPAARRFLLERFNHGQSALLIAHDGTDAAGFTQLYPSFSSVSMARIFILNDLFVEHHHRQKGIGTMLLDAAARYAQTLGAIRLSLTTAHTNKTAQAVYEAAGWQKDEVFLTYHLKPESRQGQ